MAERKQKWVVLTKSADFQKISQEFSIDPVVARIIRNRDVIGEDAIRRYLYGGTRDLYDPFLLKDMEKAVQVIEDAIRSHKRIRIIGDYDIDGICATYILYRGFQMLGAEADYDIPDRILDGYGINERLITQAAADKIQVIVTCDNGIAALEPLALAARLGITVVVTDHHEVRFEECEESENRVKEILPITAATVNPKQRKCNYPFKGLCGASVAFKLIQALVQTDTGKTFSWEKDLAPLLAFCAIATVGDVMDLVDENRILVKLGLEELHHTENPGLKALARANGLMLSGVESYQIGFVLGPCLNASGRLDTAKRALKMLLTENEEQAALMAEELVELNQSRKLMTEQQTAEAVRFLQEHDAFKQPVYVIYLPDCHESLAGIIAGRIRESYGHPTIVLTDAENGLKGSGRSIEAYSMFEELQKCADLLTKFGGHPMAAGLSLEKKNLSAFCKRLNQESALTDTDFADKVRIDLSMPFSYIREELVVQLELLKPFGKGNEKPLFAERNVEVLRAELSGRNRNVVRLSLKGSEGTVIPAVCFRDAERLMRRIEENSVLMITYFPQINEFRGRKTLQIQVVDFQ